MDSSFLISSIQTFINVGLGLYCLILFLKLLIQFGLPNHPVRFTAYLVSFCGTSYFVSLALVDLQVIAPWDWMNLRALPLVAGGLCLLLQAIMMIGDFSLIQQKVVSRVPLIASLLCFFFFRQYADTFFALSVAVAALFLTVSVRKARYQKRIFLKMSLMLLIGFLLQLPQIYLLHVVSKLTLFFALFYFFLFEHSFGISALVDDLRVAQDGE